MSIEVKATLERLYRSAGATVLASIVAPMIPGFVSALPAPWNLIITVPALMGLSKYLREKKPDSWLLKILPS